LEVITPEFCYSIWGSQDCQWAFLPSQGSSGGILSLWKKDSNSLIFSFMGDGFVGVCLDWGVLKRKMFIVNVYSKCDINSKRHLWENLEMSKRGFGAGAWCLVGDFNACLRSEDRRGVSQSYMSSSRSELREFGEFVEAADLLDVQLLGRKFTWFHPNGRSMSRIDRALISADWENLWGSAALWVLDRDVSDHCPLLLKYSTMDWGPKPFRFNNHWLNHKGFKKVVEETWLSQGFVGWMGYILKEKFKSLKMAVKGWNKAEFGGIDSRIEKLVVAINDLDIRGQLAGLSDQEVQLRKEYFTDLWKLLKGKEAVIFQRLGRFGLSLLL
jgi:hypothetical protein